MNITRLTSTLWDHCAVSGRPMFRPPVHATRPSFGTATDTTQQLFRPATISGHCPVQLPAHCNPHAGQSSTWLSQHTSQPAHLLEHPADSPEARFGHRFGQPAFQLGQGLDQRPARRGPWSARPRGTSRSWTYTCSDAPGQPNRRS